MLNKKKKKNHLHYERDIEVSSFNILKEYVWLDLFIKTYMSNEYIYFLSHNRLLL